MALQVPQTVPATFTIAADKSITISIAASAGAALDAAATSVTQARATQRIAALASLGIMDTAAVAGATELINAETKAQQKQIVKQVALQSAQQAVQKA